jgi:hypothetical protein
MHNSCTIFIPHTFPTSSTFPVVTTPPGRTYSLLLFSDFVKEKKMIFLLA